jgi:hypothetical protein
MALVAAVAMTLIAPAVMKAIIPADSHHNWDRRQYVAHLAALVLIGWTVPLVLLVLVDCRGRLGQVCRKHGAIAVLASLLAVSLLLARQIPIVLIVLATTGTDPMGGLFFARLFDILEHAPDASAAAILVAWSLLALTGQGTRPSNWFERLCVAVGLVWVVLGLLVVPAVWYAPVPWLMTSGIN